MDVPLAEDREFAMLDQEQINTLNAVERMGASLSLFGIMLIFITFAIFKRLRTIPNTFIFFASIANIGACVACLIAYDGITAMGRDRSSPLCQAQGFIFEWFMQSDPWWSFAMAINVYMVFFMSFNPTTFRHYLWLYCLICYGLPAIPAFVFLFIKDPHGLIYGDAVLWCWIASQWNALRIYSYYLPIWVCSVLSAVIYFAVGYHVFHQRNQLRNLSLSNQGKDNTTGDFSDMRDSAEKNLTSHPGPGYYGTVTTEVQVTSAAMPINPLPAYTNPFRESAPPQSNGSARRPSENQGQALRLTTTPESQEPFHVTTPAPNAPGVLSPIHTHNYPWSREPSSFSARPDVESSPTATLVNSNTSNTFGFPAVPPTIRTHAGAPAIAAAAAHNNNNNFETTFHSFNTTQYTSISGGSSPKKDDRGPSPTRLLSPTTSYEQQEQQGRGRGRSRGRRRRRHSSSDGGHHHPNNNNNKAGKPRMAGGEASGGGSSNNNNNNNINIFRRMSEGTRRFGARLRHMDPVKLAYLRTSFVFAISILVTWTPSSINRVYTLIYPDKASYGLNIAAAVVLPLQGVWNAVIYFTTSWKIFREEMEGTRAGRRLLAVLGLLHGGGGGGSSSSTAADGSGGDMSGVGVVRQSSGSFALVSSVRTPRSEMGRSRRLEGESRDGEEGVELQNQSPMSSPAVPPRPPPPARTNTMRVTQKQFDSFT